MKVLLIDNGSSHTRELALLCSAFDTKVAGVDSLDPASPGLFDAIILSGGHTKPVNGNDKFFKNELDLIDKSPVPILGVCLGFELIAHSAGIALIKLPAKDYGTRLVFPTPEGANWIGSSPVEVFESHRWIAAGIPGGYLPLATSSEGVEAIVNLSRRRAGFQFHPEHVVGAGISQKIFTGALNRLIET